VNEGDGAGVLGSGTRSGRRLLGALGLISLVLPPILAYGLYVHIIPAIQPERLGSVLPWVQALLLLAILWAVGGWLVIWRLVSVPARSEPLGPGPQDGDRPAAAGTDEVGALMSSFSRMLGGIEQQAAQINQFAHRLDSAYQELETTNAQLKEFSFKDEVTGLYNRRFFSIRLEEEVSRYRRFNHPVSVMLLDLDGFKAVNDELGHAAGDETLRDMAEILLRNSRGINVICRYGGDEFAVLLVETSKAGARLYADRIREVLSTHSFPHRRRVTASFGIASLPEDVAPAAGDLLRAADEALYAAKRAGKNRVSVYEDIAAPDAIQPERARE
jgi:diguanylate cyclase (GGDEF)-like protein